MTTKPRNPTCIIATTEGPLTLPAEPINQHLTITPNYGVDPQTNRWVFGGDFVLTHTATGAAISEGAACINCARRLGKAVAALPLNWEALTFDNAAEWLAAIPAHVRADLNDARAFTWNCDTEPCTRRDNT